MSAPAASTEPALARRSRDELVRKMTGYYETQVVYVAAKLGLPDAIARGVTTPEALADAVGADACALERFLRALAGAGVVAECSPGRFALTAVGELLRTAVPGSLREQVILNGELNYAAFGSLLAAVQRGRSPFAEVHGAPFFEYLAGAGAMGAIFDGFMARVTANVARALLAAVDLSRVGAVVDVGGGCGTLLAAVLAAHPAARGVLLERPVVVARARRFLEARGVGARCEVVAGDFFDAVPRGGDAYLLCQALHDWDDERCGVILANIRAAMAPAGRLLVIERLEPHAAHAADVAHPTHVTRDGGAAGGCARDPFAESDLYMLVLTGGRERTLAAYRALFRAAGLELTRVTPIGAGWSALEAAAGGPT